MTDDFEIKFMTERLRITIERAEAAEDRVEALTEQLDAARHDADEAEAYAWQLEQRLAKAVEALEKIAKPKVGPDFDWSDAEADRWRAVWYSKYGDIARATLAELKGETDD